MSTTATTAAVPSVAAGTHVSVRLPHIGALPATVEAAEPGGLVVVLAVEDSRVARLAGQEASVECATARGIHRYTGALELTPSRPELLRVAVTGEAERIQRREWARIEACVPIAVAGIQEKLGGTTHTVNVSGGGVLIQDAWELPLGLDVRIELEVAPGEPPVKALGRVVRDAGPGLKGIRIDDLGRDDENRLIRFVRDRERAALRMSRR